MRERVTTSIAGRLATLLFSGLACAAVLALPVPAAGATTVTRWGSFGAPPPASTPAAIEGLKNVIAVDASNSSDYALESDGSVWAWGVDRAGQFGDGGGPNSYEKAVRVPLPTDVRFTAIGEAEFVGVAIDAAGHAWAWGDGGFTACLGEQGSYGAPPQEVPGIAHAVEVQGGGHHTIWLLANRTVETCGSNVHGQLGVPGIKGSATPVQVPGLSDVVEVSAAERTSCARTASGAVYDWGANWSGQIGNGKTSEAVFTPYKVPLPGPASEVSCGGNVATDDYTLALVNGQVYGWGADEAGQIGDGSTGDRLSPVATGLRFSQVVASGGTSYGLNAAGDVWAWGSAFEDALGTGKSKNALVPELVDEGVVAISGTAHDAVDLH
jgi:alpha-tubulin suppressor-like RCC1 family protein